VAQKKTWFRPGDLAAARRGQAERHLFCRSGRYDVDESQWSAQIGEALVADGTYTEQDSKVTPLRKTRQVQETEWWQLSGRHLASTRLSRQRQQRPAAKRVRCAIQPFQWQG